MSSDCRIDVDVITPPVIDVEVMTPSVIDIEVLAPIVDIEIVPPAPVEVEVVTPGVIEIEVAAQGVPGPPGAGIPELYEGTALPAAPDDPAHVAYFYEVDGSGDLTGNEWVWLP